MRLVELLVVAPVLEEVVFRAGLQEALLRCKTAPSLAIALTAAAFGLMHAVLRGQLGSLSVAVPALLIGAVYVRRRQLRYCIALHAAMNALWLVWMNTGLQGTIS
jgi:membrane protease YdiL (CAAX protease family)